MQFRFRRSGRVTSQGAMTDYVPRLNQMATKMHLWNQAFTSVVRILPLPLLAVLTLPIDAALKSGF